MDKCEKISEDYICSSEELGSGAFGIVYKGTKISEQIPVAIKTHRQPIDRDMLIQQAYILQTLQKTSLHPNIIQMHDKIIHKNRFYLILQYCQGGSLDKQILHQKLPQKKVFKYLLQLISALNFMKLSGVVHRDLKLENILIKDGMLKISDFGTAKSLSMEEIENGLMQTYVGTRMYMSPNIIKKQFYTSKCDIWSFGVMIYHILTGRHMYWKVLEFNENERREQAKELFRLEREMEGLGKKVLEGNYHGFFKEFVEKTIVVKESERCSIEQLYSWVIGVKIKTLQELEKQSEQKSILHSSNKTDSSNTTINNPEQIIVTKRKCKIKIHSVIYETNSQHVNETEDIKRSQVLLKQLCDYVLYLYQRAKIFIEVVKRKVISDNDSKYLLFFTQAIAIIIHNETLKNILTILQNQYCVFPNQQIFDGRKLNPTVRKQFQQIKSEYVINTRKALELFPSKTISTRLSKINSGACQNVIFKQHPEVIEMERNIDRYLKSQTNGIDYVEKFQEIFRVFFQKYYICHETLSFSSNIKELQIYWGYLKLANLEQQFPLEAFNSSQNRHFIDQFYTDLNGEDCQKFCEQTIVLRKRLDIKQF